MAAAADALRSRGRDRTWPNPARARHSVAHILAEEGFDTRTIADALGHSSENMARHYSRDADLTKKMGKVGEVLELRRGKEAKKATKVSNPGPNSV